MSHIQEFGPLSAFRADPLDAYRIVDFDMLSAVFHHPSGTTHLVEPLVPELLAMLAAKAMDAAAVLAELESRGAVEADGDAQMAIAARLQQLEAAGLIERA